MSTSTEKTFGLFDDASSFQMRSAQCEINHPAVIDPYDGAIPDTDRRKQP
jgi:hypothetical protein